MKPAKRTKPAKPKGDEASERARLSLDLDTDTKTGFETVRAREGVASLTDLIKKSVKLFDIVTANQKAGVATIFRHPDGKEERIVLL